MLRKFHSIKNFGVFQNFDWTAHVKDKNGAATSFQDINIFYGRNYSGKTTLSRILRAIETGQLPNKFEQANFEIQLSNGNKLTHENLTESNFEYRVFNEDFVRENLKFIYDPESSIEAFAVLGEDNNKVELEIKAIDAELGSNEHGKETGLYEKRKQLRIENQKQKNLADVAKKNLEDRLIQKATGDRDKSIKYRSKLFGDQIYTIVKLKDDISTVLSASYQTLSKESLAQHETVIAERSLSQVNLTTFPKLQLNEWIENVKALITKPISASGKIENLVRDAMLNNWVKKGHELHKNNHSECGFCKGQISNERWQALEQHFDEESENLARELDAAITALEADEKYALGALRINPQSFYSKFENEIQELSKALDAGTKAYSTSIQLLIAQLKKRKVDLLNPQVFVAPSDSSEQLTGSWSKYTQLCEASNAYGTSLATEKTKSQAQLRLHEVKVFVDEINYRLLREDLASTESALASIESEGNALDQVIQTKESLRAEKLRALNDEEKGALRVNEYLNHHFGHAFLSLQAIKNNSDGQLEKAIHFEVVRNGKKAFHLSEGECSLIAFCYFLAKLDDIATQGKKPVIWIDDPISSLDSNHVFFVFSLIQAQILSKNAFSQLFISTHNLDFFKYLKRIHASKVIDGNAKELQKAYFLIERRGTASYLLPMPKYLSDHVTEFHYLFHQIVQCSKIISTTDDDHHYLYSFGNNARKFLEIYLLYKFPNEGCTLDTLTKFFDAQVPAILTDRINNEYSHLSSNFERGQQPIEIPEMQSAATLILKRLKALDCDQFSSLLSSVGESEETP